MANFTNIQGYSLFWCLLCSHFTQTKNALSIFRGGDVGQKPRFRGQSNPCLTCPPRTKVNQKSTMPPIELKLCWSQRRCADSLVTTILRRFWSERRRADSLVTTVNAAFSSSSFSLLRLLFSQKGLSQGFAILHALLTHKNIRIPFKKHFGNPSPALPP